MSTDSYYQWIKGEQAPNIEKFLKNVILGEKTFLLFESGNQVNQELIGDFIVSIPNPESPFIDPIEFSKSSVITYDQYTNNRQQNIDEKINLGKADVIPHPDDLKATQDFYRSQQKIQQIDVGLSPPIKHFQKEPPKIEVNPIQQLIEKTKKTETEVILNLKINLPSKAFFDVLKESFEGQEESIVKFVLELFKTEDFNLKLENFVRYYLEIQKPVQLKNSKTPPQKRKAKKAPVGEKKIS